MKWRGLPMTDENVRRIMRGEKDQTRRVMKIQPEKRHQSIVYAPGDLPEPETWDVKPDEFAFFVRHPVGDYGGPPYETDFDVALRCPFGVPGDRLYLREGLVEMHEGWGYRVDKALIWIDSSAHPSRYAASLSWAHHKEQSYSASIFMPKFAARTGVEITNVRAQRLQEILEDDARAEGITEPKPAHGKWCDPARGREGHWSYRLPFSELWDNINAKRGFSWAANHWVWAITFRRLTAAEFNAAPPWREAA